MGSRKTAVRSAFVVSGARSPTKMEYSEGRPHAPFEDSSGGVFGGLGFNKLRLPLANKPAIIFCPSDVLESAGAKLRAEADGIVAHTALNGRCEFGISLGGRQASSAVLAASAFMNVIKQYPGLFGRSLGLLPGCWGTVGTLRITFSHPITPQTPLKYSTSIHGSRSPNRNVDLVNCGGPAVIGSRATMCSVMLDPGRDGCAWKLGGNEVPYRLYCSACRTGWGPLIGRWAKKAPTLGSPPLVP